MAIDLRGYSADEVLNKVLNTSTDSIKVDIVAGAEYAEDAAHTTEDTGQFVLGVRNDTLAALGGTDGDYVPFQMNADGALFIDVANGGVLESAVDGLETLLTAANVDHAAIEVLLTAANVDHAANEALLITIDEDTNAIKGHVDGIETLITSTNSKIDTFDAVLDNILTKNTEIDAVLDTIDADTGAIKTAVEVIDNAIIGSEMQVDVVAALPAGSNTIGKLAANSGVDIGDVDITSIAAGDNNIGNVDIVSLPASTNTIEVVGDAAENANAAGNPVLVGGRYDASGTNDGGLRTLGTTDVGALALDPKGVLLTKDFTGQAGSILVTGTGAIAAGYGKFIAIQFIEDTVFSSSASGLSGTDLQRWPDDTGVGSDISSNGAAIDGVTFPQGMTIFGRWDGFTLASGKVIAYVGYV